MSKVDTTVVPEEFAKVIRDFVRDIRATFPEFHPLINKWWAEPIVEFDYIDNDEERKQAIAEYEKDCISYLFTYCQKKLPQHFFEILYQNEDIFNADSTVDTEFLPNIHFKNLWQFDITQKTRDTIWKYLQLILFSIIGTLDNQEAFGDTAKLFEAINEDDFKSKLEETLKQMEGLFNSSTAQEDNNTVDPDLNTNLPNADDIHGHINSMLEGKLGKLAKEIAEETAQDLNVDMENTNDMKDVFNKLIKNPTKLMSLVKTVGEKLDNKIKSGEIKESELIAEATEMMNKMKNMPGMDNIQSMLGKMGIPGIGGRKMNMAAMEAQLNRNMKAAKMRERMKSKVEQKYTNNKSTTPLGQAQGPTSTPMNDEEIISIFSTGETVERTPRNKKPTGSSSNINPSSDTTKETKQKQKKHRKH